MLWVRNIEGEECKWIHEMSYIITKYSFSLAWGPTGEWSLTQPNVLIFCKESILSGDLKLNLLQNVLKERACWKSDFPCPRLPLVSVTPYRNKKENVFYFLTSHRRNDAYFLLVRLVRLVLFIYRNISSWHKLSVLCLEQNEKQEVVQYFF